MIPVKRTSEMSTDELQRFYRQQEDDERARVARDKACKEASRREMDGRRAPRVELRAA